MDRWTKFEWDLTGQDRTIKIGRDGTVPKTSLKPEEETTKSLTKAIFRRIAFKKQHSLKNNKTFKYFAECTFPKIYS